jgi:rhamnulokinase
MLEKAFRMVPQSEIFERTGIQFMQINSLYQLLSMAGSPALEIAHTFLTIPDLLNFWLCGEKVCEFTNATTTQMYDQRAGGWAAGMLRSLGLPAEILPQVVSPGANLGKLLPGVSKETGVRPLPVIAPACHDTGSAVAAVPALKGNFAYISSGTWSLVGTETAKPVISARSFEYNFTNEGGVAGTVRLLKNVTGLWLVQECRRAWANAGESFSYAELAQMASDAPSFGALIDPDASEFLHPENMPDAIARKCVQTGQSPPQTRGALLRCIFESLALKYRWVLERLEELSEKPVETIHIIGGGSQNAFLNQLTADASGIPVVAGPVEATALGNAMLQAVSLGYFASVQEARQIIAQSLDLRPYAPKPDSRWEEAYARFVSILSA